MAHSDGVSRPRVLTAQARHAHALTQENAADDTGNDGEQEQDVSSAEAVKNKYKKYMEAKRRVRSLP